MSLSLLNGVFGACGAPAWSGNNDAVDLTVEKNGISFDTLRQLESCDIFAERLSCPSNPSIQADFNANKSGTLPPTATFRLKLPRVIGTCVVAKNLASLISISSATYKEPKSYFLVNVEDSNKAFCFINQASLADATPLIKRYHDSIKLWQIIEGQAEHSVAATHHLLFFGIRRTEISPVFAVSDLEDNIAFSEISDFTTNPDREETRKDIFRAVLSEFLQDQKADRAFPYLLRQSSLFARRLREGMAIYLSEYSPEKLAQEAQAKYLELADKLEKTVSGIEAKSLTVPAAVLLAVKEADFAAKWTTLNVIIIVSTGLYLIAMLVVFLSQRAVLQLLKTTIQQTKKELKEQGLDDLNPVIKDSFARLEARRRHTHFGSWVIFLFSFVPLLAVIYAVFFAAPPASSSYTFKLSPTNGVQIIQTTNSQTVPGIKPASPSSTNAPAIINP